MGWEDRPYNREENGGVPPVVFSFPKMTRLTMAIIGTCLLVFILQSADRSGTVDQWFALTFRDHLAFVQPWRFITYQYLHGGAGHIFFNMLGVYFFLPTLEMLWGWRKAFAFYTIGGVVSGIVYGLITIFIPSGGLIGASGSIFAILGAVALLSPNRQLILLFFPVPIRVAAALFGAFFLLSTLADHNPSDAAHLGGLVFGFFAPWIAGPVVGRYAHQYRRRRVLRESQLEQREQQQIDTILAKVSQNGMNSLTKSERRTLQRATDRQRHAETTKRRRAF